MKEYVLDANAVTRYLGISKGGGEEKVSDLFELGRQQRVALLMSVVSLGEVSYILLKHIGQTRTDAMIKRLLHGLVLFDAGRDTVLEASRDKDTYHVSYADAFAVALSLKRKATLVSADPVFEKFGKSLRWLRLPGYAGRK